MNIIALVHIPIMSNYEFLFGMNATLIESFTIFSVTSAQQSCFAKVNKDECVYVQFIRSKLLLKYTKCIDW